MHPNYDDANPPHYDFAIFVLDGASTYDVIELDDGSTSLATGDDIITAGWGITESGATSDVLLEVSMDYYTNKKCSQKWWGEYITDDMLCLWADGKSSCNGDSGGPTFVENSDGSVTQVGEYVASDYLFHVLCF